MTSQDLGGNRVAVAQEASTGSGDFDARDARCEKCGSDDINVSWHGKGGTHKTRRYAPCSQYGDDWGKPHAEHLHYHCRTCQFDWTGGVAAPADAQRRIESASGSNPSGPAEFTPGGPGSSAFSPSAALGPANPALTGHSA